MITLLAFQAVVVGWVPPAQAVWRSETQPIATVELAPLTTKVSMSGEARLLLKLRTKQGDFSVSPFLQYTRGIALTLRDGRGRLVSPAEPPPFAPPAPPVEEERLTHVTSEDQFQVEIREPAKWVFPRPGTYHITAAVTLMNCRSELGCLEQAIADPRSHAKFFSAPIKVMVIK